MIDTLARVRVLATGGTIAGSADRADAASSYTAATLSLDAILDTIPGLSELARIDAQQIAAIDSKDADPAFWQSLARHIQAALDAPDVDAVIVLHGTDTMEESAWFAQLALSPRKPVVFTGAMRPATAVSADGPMNVLQAMRVALDPGAAGRGVLAVMNGAIHSARYLRKTHGSHVQAFSSGAAGQEGEVFDTVRWFRDGLPAPTTVAVRSGAAGSVPQPEDGARNDRPGLVEHLVHIGDKNQVLSAPLPRVDLLVAYPGAPTDMIDHVVRAGAQGIVFAGTGQGTLSAAVQAALAQARQQGVVVVRASKVDEGQAYPEAGCPDAALGFLTSGGLSAAKARVALMLALAGEAS